MWLFGYLTQSYSLTITLTSSLTFLSLSELLRGKSGVSNKFHVSLKFNENRSSTTKRLLIISNPKHKTSTICDSAMSLMENRRTKKKIPLSISILPTWQHIRRSSLAGGRPRRGRSGCSARWTVPRGPKSGKRGKRVEEENVVASLAQIQKLH